MNGRPSTIRISNQPTIEDPLDPSALVDLTDCIIHFWRGEACKNVIRTIEAFPSLGSNRSLVIDLAVEEFKVKGGQPEFDTQEYCEQFRKFGSHYEQSIHRAIEVQNYLNEHPELLQVVAEFKWPTVGESVHGFEVLEELGRGALARVYLCRETELAQRVVVVKVARSDGYEAELLARLDHPNIVPVHSVTIDNEHYVTCICMPFKGRSTLQDLADRIARGIPKYGSVVEQVARQRELQIGGCATSEPARVAGGTPYIEKVIDVLSALADALVHAHGLGVLHGDLKPSNVILTSDGEPLLIDFNLAREHANEATPRGGTLAYMPPETLRVLAGDSDSGIASFDARSEVYSFGVLMYQLTTGQLPYGLDPYASEATAISRDLLHKQCGPKPNVRSSNPACNSGFEQLITECLATDPADRPATMLEVAERLRFQASVLPRMSRWVRSHPVRSVVGAITAVAAFVCLTVYLLLRPPYHARQFQRGLEYQAEKEFESAVACFGRAMDDPALRHEAMYERARSYLYSDEPALALNEFGRSEAQYHDNRSTAEIGYCFNLRGDHDAAIASYEKSLVSGFETAELHNNLGISYATTKSYVDEFERFDRAAGHLNRAIELKHDLVSARVNLITTFLIGRVDSREDEQVERVVESLEWLLRFRSNDAEILRKSSQAYGKLAASDSKYVDRCAEVCRLAIEAGAGPTPTVLNVSLAFLRDHPDYQKLCDLASDSRPSHGILPPRFVDPVGDAQPASADQVRSIR